MTGDQDVHRSFAVSHVGSVRTLNEDSFLCDDSAGLWVVADGVGGLDAGDEASRRVIRALANSPPTGGLAEAVTHVKSLLAAENLRMVEDRTEAGGAMGTTVVALLIRGEECDVIWAGDSRCYRYRRNVLTRLSRDHSRVQSLVDAGAISLQQARDHPQRNVITRAVGARADFAADSVSSDISPGDIFILCSDGLTTKLDDDEIAAVLAREHDPERACSALVDCALAKVASDNVTVIVLRAGTSSAKET